MKITRNDRYLKKAGRHNCRHVIIISTEVRTLIFNLNNINNHLFFHNDNVCYFFRAFRISVFQIITCRNNSQEVSECLWEECIRYAHGVRK